MPPAAGKKAAARSRATTEDDAHTRAAAVVATLRKALIEGFQKVQKSMSAHQAQRTRMMELLDENPHETKQLLCAICVKTLCIQQSPQYTQRHTGFIADLCKTVVHATKKDDLSIDIMRAVLPYHAAKDKTVRYGVCALVQPLLKTLLPDVNTDDRNDFYESIVEVMKERAHDVHHAVRESAIAALATFHQGKKDDDLTQLIIVSSCEDANPNVRKIVASCAMEKEAYFPPLARLTQDVVPAVRKAAWDALRRFKFTHVVAFCHLYKLDFIDLVHRGLHDASLAVKLSTEAAIHAWLVKTMQGNAVELLSKVSLAATNATAVDSVAAAVYAAAVKFEKASGRSATFPLVKDALTPANLTLWRVCAKAMVSSDNANEAGVLPPLLEFSYVLQDVTQAFIDPDKTQGQHASLVNADHADHVLRIMLSMFAVYEEGGYLAHTDDTARAAIVRNLGVLLKVVTDADPGLYVQDVMRGLSLIAARHPEQIAKLVEDTLEMLFKALTLPKQYDLGFDDVETFGRRDAERREERERLSARGVSSERLRVIEDSIESDTLYLLRMQHVVVNYLSQLKRGDKVPHFCAHIIQLGRFQAHDEVKALAVRSLGIQCMMAPETTHTFLPVIIADATSPRDSTTREAALCVVFDLLAEYAPKFFESGTGESYAAEKSRIAALAAAEGDKDVDAREELERRRDLEAVVAREDAAKVGRNRLLDVCFAAIGSDHATTRRIAQRGFSKLLPCGRLDSVLGAEAIALMLVGMFSFEVAATLRRGQSDVVGAFVYRQLDFFFQSFAGSDPRRMKLVAEGGLLAVRAIFARQNVPAPHAAAQRILRRLATYTDAALLQVVRDVDPEFAANAMREHDETDMADQHDRTADETSTVVSRSKKSATTASSAQGSARVWRMLSQHSTHEFVAQELLEEIALQRGNVGAQRCCVGELPKLKLYGRDPQVTRAIVARGEAAAAAAADDAMALAINDFVDACQRFVSLPEGATSPSRPSDGSADRRATQLQRVLPRMAFLVEEISASTTSRMLPPSRRGKQGRSASNANDEDDSPKQHRVESGRSSGRTSGRASGGAAPVAMQASSSSDDVNLLPPSRLRAGRR